MSFLHPDVGTGQSITSAIPMSIGKNHRSNLPSDPPNDGPRGPLNHQPATPKREKPNTKVTDMFTNGVVPARSRPYDVDNENDGDSVEAHDRAVTNQDGGNG